MSLVFARDLNLDCPTFVLQVLDDFDHGRCRSWCLDAALLLEWLILLTTVGERHELGQWVARGCRRLLVAGNLVDKSAL